MNPLFGLLAAVMAIFVAVDIIDRFRLKRKVVEHETFGSEFYANIYRDSLRGNLGDILIETAILGFALFVGATI